MISVKNLSVSFGKEQVLKDININFLAGHIYGLVGVNGCGKTTLMRCICGLIRPNTGEIVVNGKRVGKDVDFAPNTGIIIETPGFLPHLSALRNLLILANISKKITKPEVASVIARLGLNPNDKKPVGKFSLGMRQRLGIAQAIMENPDILILDEPFNGLDMEANSDIHELLKDLKNKGKCIILASHSKHDIMQSCDTLCIFQNGQLSIEQ